MICGLLNLLFVLFLTLTLSWKVLNNFLTEFMSKKFSKTNFYHPKKLFLEAFHHLKIVQNIITHNYSQLSKIKLHSVLIFITIIAALSLLYSCQNKINIFPRIFSFSSSLIMFTKCKRYLNSVWVGAKKFHFITG